MILRQKSAFTAFSYEFLEDETHIVLGEFHYAWFSQAKNARLRVHSAQNASNGDIQLSLHGRSWRIRYLYLRRGYTNDFRYTLETANETIHAQIDVLNATPALRLPKVVMDLPFRAELSTSPGWLRKKFTLMDRDTQQPIGDIQERSIFATKRELQINLPSCEPAVAAFWGIVTLIARF